MLSKTSHEATSISKRVTVWYSSFFLILATIIFSGIFLLSDYYITSTAKSQLENAVLDSVGDVVEGDFEPVDEGVFLSFYSQSGQLLEGSVPISAPIHFRHGTLSELVFDDTRYLYYDHFDDVSKKWFRGILSVRQNDLIRQNLLMILLLALPLVMLVILGGGIFIIRRALSPIQTMADTAQTIHDDLDLSKRMPEEKTPKELFHLAHAFNSMLDRVQDSYDREKQFTGDVSHELRTPLAVIQSESDYLAQRNLDSDARDSLSIIQRQTRHMTKLIGRLLDMARIEHTNHLTVTTVNFSALLYELVESYQLLTDSLDKSFISDIQEYLILSGDPQLLKRLVDNLLSNALKFSKKRFYLSAQKIENSIILIVGNDGEPIASEVLPKIWNRLYQADLSRAGSGLGLGLSFVKKIADLHEATIEVSSNQENTLFYVSFPSSSNLHL